MRAPTAARMTLHGARRLLPPVLGAPGRKALRRSGPTARTLVRSLTRRLDPAERRWVARIEDARRALERSSGTVAFEEADGAYERSIAELCATSSKSSDWTLLLFRLLRQLRPEACLELGSCVGVSAAYQAAALELNGCGRLVTIEGRPAVARIAHATVAELGLGGRVDGRIGWFEDVLGGALADLGTVDYAFIDGHHEERATLAYFDRIAPRLSSGAVIVLDDISWSDGMRSAWRTITERRETADALDLDEVGVWVNR